jgi:hypothetical protein
MPFKTAADIWDPKYRKTIIFLKIIIKNKNRKIIL